MAAAAIEPKVIQDKAAMHAWSRRSRVEGKTVALVPTMGFLHEGHLSLISAATAAGADTVAVVVSIYVNPSKLASTGVVAAVFCPPDLYVRTALPLLKRPVRDLDFAIEIIGSEIVREADGLAMSSRNVHLLREEREKSGGGATTGAGCATECSAENGHGQNAS